MATVRTASDARLDRRPEATAYSVDDLMRLVTDGRLRVPNFQRRLRWKDKDYVDLFDSLYKGYPIGTLLLWKHDGIPEKVTFGSYEVTAGELRDALYLVDGQQRVTTLAATLLVSHQGPGRTMIFDLDTEEFRYARVRPQSAQATLGPEGTFDPSSAQIPVSVLFDSRSLIRWFTNDVKRGGSTPPFMDRALECGKRLRDYRVPAYVVETEDHDVLRMIFDRTNRTGRRLDEVDVFNALFSTQAENGTAANNLARVVSAVASEGFGELPEDTVLKALRAVTDLPLDKDFTKDLERDHVPGALQRTEAALQRTVTFLRNDAMIPHFALNPYELPIIVLARFFDLFPDPLPRNRILLRRWIWRGSLAGKLSGATVSLRQHVDAVRDNEESDSVQRILALSPVSDGAFDVPMQPYAFGTARTKAELCALASLLPRDVADGSELYLPGLLNARDKAVLTITRAGELPLSRCLANRILHPATPPKELAALIGQADPGTLESHAIPVAAVEALATGDNESFLRLRAEELSSVTRKFFAWLTESNADDSPPLSALIELDAS